MDEGEPTRMRKPNRACEMDVIEDVRQKRIWKLIPVLPKALDTLSRCLAQPCDAQRYAWARAVVLEWLQFTKYCESHAIAKRGKVS